MKVAAALLLWFILAGQSVVARAAGDISPELNELANAPQMTALLLGTVLAAEQYCKMPGSAVRAAKAFKINRPSAKPASMEMVQASATTALQMFQRGELNCATARLDDADAKATINRKK